MVSILIPLYNSENYIKETLRSCVEQTYQDIEIIIVDDGSTDRSLAIAREWEAKYHNIHVYSQTNSGACRARNLAFEQSHGDYIMYLDADDVISYNKIDAQMQSIAKAGSLTISTSPWNRFSDSIKNAEARHYSCYRDYNKGIDLLIDLWENGEMYAVSCYLTPRSLIEKAGKWDEKLKINQDGEFFSRVLAVAGHIVFNPDSMFFYRTGDYASVSKGKSYDKAKSLLKSYVSYKSILQYEDSERVRKALARNFAFFRYMYNGLYPNLSRKALAEIKDLGVKTPIVGSPRAIQLSKLIGFENFLRLRKIIMRK